VGCLLGDILMQNLAGLLDQLYRVRADGLVRLFQKLLVTLDDDLEYHRALLGGRATETEGEERVAGQARTARQLAWQIAADDQPGLKCRQRVVLRKAGQGLQRGLADRPLQDQRAA